MHRDTSLLQCDEYPCAPTSMVLWTGHPCFYCCSPQPKVWRPENSGWKVWNIIWSYLISVQNPLSSLAAHGLGVTPTLSSLSTVPFFASVKSQLLPLKKTDVWKFLSCQKRTASTRRDTALQPPVCYGMLWTAKKCSLHFWDNLVIPKHAEKNSSFFSGEVRFLIDFKRYERSQTVPTDPRHLVPSSNSWDCREYLKGWEGKTSLEACT